MAAFALRYFAELRSQYTEVFWRVEIEDNQFVGHAEEVYLENTEEAITINWEKRDDEFYSPVKGSEASLVLHCLENFKFLDLFTSDSRRYRVSIYRNTKLYWRGFVVADLYSEDFAKPPYPVNVKAVDGFNILSNKEFVNSDGKPFAGLVSLWQLVYGALEQMGLELDVADWCDLYALGMDENQSPLTQAFIETKMLYTVYDKPTWRDVLELAVKPFSAQIFQSNGSIHIRRVVSLYNDIRPYSFYNVGTKFPTGWLVTHDGRTLTTASGQVLVTQYSRKRIESMWEGDIVVEDSSQLEIVPPLKSIKITQTNKLIENLWVPMGLFNPLKWSHPAYMAHSESETLQFNGTENPKNEWCMFDGYPIEASSYPAKMEFMLKAKEYWYETKTFSNYLTRRVPAIYAIVLINDIKTLYLNYNDQINVYEWREEEGFIVDDFVKPEQAISDATWEINKKIDIPAFPINGSLRFMIKQNLKTEDFQFPVWGSFKNVECFLFEKFILKQEYGDAFDQSLETELVVNRSNNYVMELTMPVADIPQIPNATLIYSLYLVDAAGVPTALWHSRARRDYGTLQHHLVQCALQFKKLAAKKIAADTFTGVHIDLNTVLQDDKFLNVGYYVNAIELSCLSDKFGIEFVELPGLLSAKKPAPGDDCVADIIFDIPIKTAVRCRKTIVMLDTSGGVWLYDVEWARLAKTQTRSSSIRLFSAPQHFVLADTEWVEVYDEQGVLVLREQLAKQAGFESVITYSDGPITYMDGAIYMAASDNEGGRVNHRVYWSTPAYGYQAFIFDKEARANLPIAKWGVSESALAFVYQNSGSSSISYLGDNRTLAPPIQPDIVAAIPTGLDIVALSDRVLCAADQNTLKVYRRHSLAASDVVHVRDEAALPSFVDASYAQAAFVAPNGAVSLWDEPTDTVYQAINAKGSGSPLRGVLLIEGTLYIVRDNGVYHLVP